MPRAQLIAAHLGVHGEDEAVHGLIVPGLPEHGMDEFVPAGTIVEGPPELIGAAPHWRAPKPGEDTSWMERTFNEDGTVRGVRDLGHGLLAQVDVWANPDSASNHENGEG